jgi:TRAP-type C4-dicarboxylate transport system permease small subunit
MLKSLKKLSDLVDSISLSIAAFMIATILALTVIGAVSRYVFFSPLSWPMPVSQILMIWSALLGIPAGLKRGEHMGVVAIFKVLPQKAEMILRYTDYLLIFLFTLILIWFGWIGLRTSNDTFMITRNLRIGSEWLVSAIPASGIIQLVHLFSVPYLIEETKKKDSLSEEITGGIKRA